jgi:poly(glycerol-phosphate) alpha-glucosyltransferase
MPKNTPIFVFRSLDVVRGGLTKAVLTRANALIKHFDEVVFLTLEFQPGFNKIKEELYTTGKLDKRVKVFNLFNDVIGNKKKKKIKQNKEHSIEERAFFVFKDDNNDQPSYRYYQNGLYKKYKRFDKNNNLIFVDYMNESRTRYQRDEYEENGALVRSRQMDLYTNKPKLDRYFNYNGECHLSVWIDPTTSKEKRTLCFGKQPKQYKSLEDFILEWVEAKVRKFKEPVIMSDSRSTDSLVTKVRNAKKVAILHNNHYKKPYDNSSEIKKTWDPFFENINQFNRIVFLTEEQKNDVADKFGELASFTVIPHAAMPVNTLDSGKSVSYNPFLAVTLARYNSQKRLDEAIRAFKYVVEELPTAEYHIYGFGPLHEDLKHLIKQLGLVNNVKLKGFTSDTSYTYKAASCSILTSDYEGFGLVLTESLASGTPVVAYDIKYGPKDIVRDGVDGFLVHKGDSKGIANKIVEIMGNKELRERLSNNATEVLTRFSESDYVDSWVVLLKEINQG